jgi:hypothetical protein
MMLVIDLIETSGLHLLTGIDTFKNVCSYIDLYLFGSVLIGSRFPLSECKDFRNDMYDV